MTTQQYRELHLRRTKRLERDYYPAVLAGVRQQVNAFFAIYRDKGLDAARATKLPAAKITAAISDMYRTVGLFYARLTLRQIKASAEVKAGFGLNEELVARIIEYLTSFLLTDVANITETTKLEILRVVSKGQTEGWGVDRMAKEITDMPIWRSRMIVRTELVKAMNAGQQAGKEESEWESIDTWVSAEDERTRRSHMQADGQRVRGGNKFHVSKKKGGFDMMTGPGDPTASAENVINCRCTKVSRAARDEKGRLIRKRKIFVALPGERRQPTTTILV